MCFTVILVSGINISKVVFTGVRGASSLKTAHYALSALALLLLGVHLGMHYESIITRTSIRKLPVLLRRIAAIVLSVLILGFGVYQMSETSFLQWLDNLGAVISASEAMPDGDHDPGDMQAFDGETPAFDSETDETQADTDAAAVTGEDDTYTDEAFSEGGHSNGPQDGTGKGLGTGRGAEQTTNINAATIASVLLNFLCITLSLSVAVAWIDGIQRSVKRKKLLANAQTEQQTA